MESEEIFVAEFAFTTEGENYRGKRTISSFVSRRRLAAIFHGGGEETRLIRSSITVN